MYNNMRYARNNSKRCHLQELKEYIIKAVLHRKEDLVQYIQKYWPIRYELARKDDMVIKAIE